MAHETVSQKIDWEKAKFEFSGEKVVAHVGNPESRIELENLRSEIRPVFEARGGPREGEVLGPVVRLSRDQGLQAAMVLSGEIERLREAALEYKEEGRTWYYVFPPTEVVVGVWRIRE